MKLSISFYVIKQLCVSVCSDQASASTLASVLGRTSFVTVPFIPSISGNTGIDVWKWVPFPFKNVNADARSEQNFNFAPKVPEILTMNSGRSLLEFSCYEMNHLESVIQWKRLTRFQDAAGRYVKLCLQMILSTSRLLLWEIKKWQTISPSEPNFWQCMNLVLTSTCLESLPTRDYMCWFEFFLFMQSRQCCQGSYQNKKARRKSYLQWDSI